MSSSLFSLLSFSEHPEMVFLAGFVILVLFFWYVVTDSALRRRYLGTALTLTVMIVCALSFYGPMIVDKQEGTGPAETTISDASKSQAQPLPPKYQWKQQINLGLDLQGGTSFLIRLKKEEGRTPTKEVLDQAVEVIRKRVDAYGIGEPVITPQGADRILVQIPGLDADKIAEAREQLRKVAKLEFHLVHPDSDRLVQAIEAGQAPIPPGYVLKTEEINRNGVTVEGKLLIKKQADIQGKHVLGGRPMYDQGYGVSLQFTSEGKDIFGKLTSENVGKRFAILLDDKVQSAPVIREPIWGGNASITGRFTQQEAHNLASVLENPLSVPVEIEEERSASATLGADSIMSGIYAGIGGLLLVLVVVALYYRLAGLIAILAMMVNVLILLGIMGMFHFVLTLPGIAGIILTIGLSVDANVLIYERLREELASGKSLAAAIQGAYSKAFTVIFDANATTLITAGILFWYAAGPVKGFAVTLTVGVIASVFTAMVVGRNCFDWGLAKLGLQKIKMHHLISDKMNINFLGKRHLWIGISLAVIAVSIATFAIRGEKNFGIDFKGGDLLMLSAKANVTESQIRAELEKINIHEPVIQKEHEAGGAGGDYISIRSGDGTAEKIQDYLIKAMPDAGFKVYKIDHVGTLVGAELARNSAIALILGIVGIMIYVTIRFEFSFAVGAVVALLHDVIITVGVFSMIGAFTGRELSLVMVGAILTIAGYSINDTIVVYDRIREGLHSGRKGSIQEIMNASINETLSRTLITSTLTLFSVAALFFFGGATLNDFALAILIGVVVGTYSSIFIASPIVLWWSRGAGENLARQIKKKGESPAVEA